MYGRISGAYALVVNAAYGGAMSKIARAACLDPAISLTLAGTHTGLDHYPAARFTVTKPGADPATIVMARADVDFVLNNTPGLSAENRAVLEDSKAVIAANAYRAGAEERSAFEASLFGRSCSWIARRFR